MLFCVLEKYKIINKKMEENNNIYQISIDTGGTFTDCIAKNPSGEILKTKVLSNGTLRALVLETSNQNQLKINSDFGLKKNILNGYKLKFNNDNVEFEVLDFDVESRVLTFNNSENSPIFMNAQISIFANEESPVLACRIITETALNENFPSIELKLGSTKGTNALLEKKGAKTAFLVTKGFKDLLKIGNQTRQNLFALHIKPKIQLPSLIIEIDEETDANGKVIKGILEDSFENIKIQLQQNNIESIAICLKNSFQNPENEIVMFNYLKFFFNQITISTGISTQIKYLERSQTSVVNAYLSPILSSYLVGIKSKLKCKSFKIMTSAGSLVDESDFLPKDSLFSGPAGGVVGAVKVAREMGFSEIITFDMGGTSTDVARFSGDFDYQDIQRIDDFQIFSRTLAIETVAAGGGSICRFDGQKFTVGPDSAGANPGPACYGMNGPLTITDVNLLLGKLSTSQFSIPIDIKASEQKLQELIFDYQQVTGKVVDEKLVLFSFITIANELMADAIRKISIAKGYDLRNFSLLAFGGAGGLHACKLAEILEIKQVLIPQNAGILSAYGISKALNVKLIERNLFEKFNKQFFKIIFFEISKIEVELFNQMTELGLLENQVENPQHLFTLRHFGQDSGIELNTFGLDFAEIIEQFQQKYFSLYGYKSENIDLEIVKMTISLSEKEEVFLNKKKDDSIFQNKREQDISTEKLVANINYSGPTVISDNFSAVYLEENWNLKINADRHLSLVFDGQYSTQSIDLQATDLTLFMNRFKAVAENMGVILQKTAKSVNIKERLDFSCGIINAEGFLIANAPHIPVHLGSLGICARKILSEIKLNEGDVLLTNHPRYGGSHLPDLTLIKPVFDEYSNLLGYVINRSHHSEIGGIRPGSMPPYAKNLEEEGVVIALHLLQKNHVIDWQSISNVLASAKYPSRNITENLEDINAALAALNNGEKQLRAMAKKYGSDKIKAEMNHILEYSSQVILKRIQTFEQKVFEAQEFLDDGTSLNVKISFEKDNLFFDFTGSSNVHNGNLNANDAIVQSVLVYVLRTLINEDIALNDGILKDFKVILPHNSILNPVFSDNPAECPAVVGGNVELSQRLTDTVFKALGVLACSQGTMNNTLFGNENFGYYETIAGGCGAGNGFEGASGVHHHMTNTRITDPEIMEYRYPVKLRKFEIRENSGGKGLWNGGNGLCREIEFLKPLKVSLLNQHRIQEPYGLEGGANGKVGEQYLITEQGNYQLTGNQAVDVNTGDILVILTPGGGGFGKI